MSKVITNAIDGTITSPVLKNDGSVSNSRADNHSRFCKRCFKHNDKCLNTGTKKLDPDCRV